MPRFTDKAMQARLEVFREGFEKDFGKGTLRRGRRIRDYGVISTGSVRLDTQLGVGGYVEGRIVEIWGPPDAGKTSFALMACVEAQRKYPNRMVAYIDAENKMDEAYADAVGVDRDRWWLYVPQTAEDVSDAAKRFLDNPDYSLVVCDSIGALISKAEQDKDASEDVVANVARIVTRMVKHATLSAPKHGAVMLILNQPRSNIARYGADTTTPGGWALKHCTTMKLQLRPSSDKKPIFADIKGEKIPVAHEIAVKVERNKVTAGGQTVRVFYKNVATEKYGPVGIDIIDETAELAKTFGLITRRANAWAVATTGEVLGSKWEDVIPRLRDRPDLVDQIRDLVIKFTAPTDIEEAPEDLEPPEGTPVLDDDPVSDIEPETAESPLTPLPEEAVAYPSLEAE